MYLNRINNQQKELFLDLCIHASIANKKFSEEEKGFISLYCNEMQLSNVRYDAETIFEDAITKLIEISSKAELNIIVLELTALVLSDHHYDESESEFMNKVIQFANIDKFQHKKMIEVLDELTSIYEKLNTIISA